MALEMLVINLVINEVIIITVLMRYGFHGNKLLDSRTFAALAHICSFDGKKYQLRFH
jgi:hypothetical protein